MAKLIYVPYDKQEQSGSQLVTLDDLEAFRVKLKMEIKLMLDGNAIKPTKRWLKSVEIRKLLNISPGTLQTLRNNGKLPTRRSAVLSIMMLSK